MMTRTSRNSKQRSASLKYGWRSGLEEAIALELGSVPFEYEKLVIKYLVHREAKYTPDFHLLPNGIILETKGRFLTQDRGKHKLVKAQHPDLDIRIVFSNANARISKTSQTTYAKWCETQGIPYAHRHVPHEWLTEKPNVKSMLAIAAIQRKQQEENAR